MGMRYQFTEIINEGYDACAEFKAWKEYKGFFGIGARIEDKGTFTFSEYDLRRRYKESTDQARYGNMVTAYYCADSVDADEFVRAYRELINFKRIHSLKIYTNSLTD